MAVNNTIQLRRGTSSSWDSTNPILAAGECGFASDINRLKIGDGILAWTSLQYINTESYSLVTTIFNNTGSPIPKMTAVYINGGQGDMPTVALAQANTESTSSKTYGLTAEAISNMSTGKVIVSGALTGLNTDQFNPTAPSGDVNGTTLWLSPSVAGALTTTKPSAPNHMVAIGTIVRTHQNAGVVEVKVQNGFELQELHNVSINGITGGEFLSYNGATSLWIANPNLFSSGSNIGIGTASPGSKLDIVGNTRINGTLSIYDSSQLSFKTITALNNNLTFGAVHGIFEYSIGLRGSRGSACGMESNTTNGYLALAAGGSEKVRIATDGNVGIGTTSPISPLHVVGSGRFVGSNGNVIIINATNENGAVSIDAPSSLYSDISLRVNSQNIFRGLDGWTATWADSAATTYFQVGRAAGNTIFTSLVGNAFNRLAYSSNKYLFTNQTTNITVPSNYFNIEYNGTSILSATTGANIGIGTTSPSKKLDVNGDVNIDGNLTFDSFTESVVAIGNSGTSQTISLTSGTVQTCTLTGNCTFTMPTATAGKSFTMFLNSGAGNFTAAFSGVRWADSAAPTATILANKVDIYSFISDGTYWYGSFSQNYG